MSEFIIREEEFRLGILDRLPVPNTGECLLLYQVGARPEDSIIIYQGSKYASAQIRHKKYNRKVTLTLNERFMSQNQKVVMDNSNYYFNISWKISFSLINPQKYFFDERVEEGQIKQVVRDTIKRNDGIWNVQQSYELRDRLEDEIAESLQQFESIKSRVQEIAVIPDANAAKIIQSDREKEVGIHIYKNETEQQISKNEQNQRIVESEYKLKEVKMQEMAIFLKNYGALGPIADDYLKGEMTGTDFYNYMMKAKADQLNILTTALESDLLTQKDAYEKISEILSDTKIQQTDEKPRIQEVEKESAKLEVKQSNETEAVTNNTLADGDYL